MKRNSCQVAVAFLLMMLLAGCQKEQQPEPQLSAAATKEAVNGKWLIAKIDYQLCRSGQCSNSNYNGSPNDYFEFRADSAFLFRQGEVAAMQKQRFKVYYNMPGAFVLSNGQWTGKFEIKECYPKELILLNTFTGTDPYAAFTDTYYLYKN